ncbi:RNA polymerase sigma-70 factor [Polaribacter sp. ALD11]|uniref:RNA polymerase sigma factor n=1 Tax=Polaribacter sp. ALD11 TaxID=2058137 RepID=UPI000C318FBF|nr:RNA polymerase sigma-70 factor [Polaribacter sp. ALD11]AUC85184.1 RNA polymerase sigma-70 factor [Polaribacter sp. ALD11]
MRLTDIYDVSDAQLLLLMKNGNEFAFNKLYDSYWKRLFLYALNILNDKGLAEDVVHEIFTNIWIKRESLDITSFENYLFVSAKNRSISLFRKVKFTELDENIITNLSLTPEIDDTINVRDLKYTIENAVKDLPSRCRDIFYLSRYDDYSNLEIANYFKISQRTVENQLYLALKHLRAVISKTISILLLFSFF